MKEGGLRKPFFETEAALDTCYEAHEQLCRCSCFFMSRPLAHIKFLGVGLDSKNRYISSAFLNAGKSSDVRRPGMPARDCCNNSFFWKDRMEGDVTGISSALPYSRDHSNLRGGMIGFFGENMGTGIFPRVPRGTRHRNTGR